jgi:glycerol kinase
MSIAREVLMNQYIIALDQGTTSSKTMIFDNAGNLLIKTAKEFTQIYPDNGWVEHDPKEIWESQKTTLQQACHKMGTKIKNIKALGISNQRETTILWDKNTGEPVYNAIVWQCRRTADYCDELIQKGLSKDITKKTGLRIDPYFSATKIRWILQNVAGVKEKAQKGDILFGTVDTWLIWNLTKGKVHVTDQTNASRTMLYNIFEDCWDDELLELFDIPKSILPKVVKSSEIVGYIDEDIIPGKIPIAGIAGDQQAALFGQCCFNPGEAKNTYGTGCFLLMNIGEKPVISKNNLLTTMICSIDGKPRYALEGSVFIGGAVVQWLRDELKIIETADETEGMARSVKDNDGVYLVPAFSGLGAPYWDPFSRGLMIGLTRNSNKNHIVRAALESIAYQVADLVKTMEKDAKLKFQNLKVDGGATVNNFLMEFQADLLNINLFRPVNTETTALGVAFLAGLSTGVWHNTEELKKSWQEDKVFVPTMPQETRLTYYQKWQKAVKRSQDWIEE